MTNKIKKLMLSAVLGIVIVFGGTEAVMAEEETVQDFGIKEAAVSDNTEEYYKELLATEKYNYKIIRNIPTAYEAQSYHDYCVKASLLNVIEEDSISERQKEKLDTVLELRHGMEQVAEESDVMWKLWGESIPTVEDEIDFSKGGYDNADFEPYLLPYLMEDQNNVKGNLIIVAGGGYSKRANETEGYPVAERFNELGYNCYVLQRRVSPYGAIDIWMDMQRSIRLVRYKVEKLGLGGEECIAATGFSGGSATVLGAIAKYYGDIQPSDTVESYVPDEIDGYNSDLDAALCIYGPNYTVGGEFKGLVTDNENLPAMFLAAGLNDTTGAPQDNITLAESVADKTMVEYHAFANAPHGFGVGTEGTNAMYWTAMADCFMDQAVAAKNAPEETK